MPGSARRRVGRTARRAGGSASRPAGGTLPETAALRVRIARWLRSPRVGSLPGLVCFLLLVPSAAAGQSAGPDTLRVPRSGAPPTLDCEIPEWVDAARMELRPGAADALVSGPVDDAADLHARVDLQWGEAGLYVMGDVRDDTVVAGEDRRGDWIQVRLAGTSVWVGAPGEGPGSGGLGVVGIRSAGEPLERMVACRTPYGWRFEATVSAREIGEALQLGTTSPLRVAAEDDDGAERGGRRGIVWRDVRAVLAPAAEAAPPPGAGPLLERLREPATLPELARRPGARDTTVTVGGRPFPAVRVRLADRPLVAFAPDSTSPVVWRLGEEAEEIRRELGFTRSVASLRAALGAGRVRSEEAMPYAWPRIEFELLPGVIFRLGEPVQVSPTPGEPPASAVPQEVYVETRRPGGAEG